MRVDVNHTTALVVDMQEKLFPHIYNNQAIQEKCVMLIKGMQLLKVQILLTQQYTKGLGPTITPIMEVLGNIEIHEKMTFSCCGNSDVESVVIGARGHSVIIMGVEAHVCIQQTVLDLLAQGRMAVVVEDCVSSRNSNDKEIAIKRMRNAGAIVTTAESLLFELAQSAEHPMFKQLSALVK
ncbi:MAG: isochorismatase family protein [Ignavibacteria bacterium]|nr:isochorismatase family protein [Ignavibacteria bacterium]